MTDSQYIRSLDFVMWCAVGAIVLLVGTVATDSTQLGLGWLAGYVVGSVFVAVASGTLFGDVSMRAQSRYRRELRSRVEYRVLLGQSPDSAVEDARYEMSKKAAEALRP